MVVVLKSLNAHVAALAANLCATAATCVMSWSSPTLPLITNPGSKILVTVEQAVWLSSIPALGAFFGPFITGRIVDFLGRKHTLLAVNLLFIITWGVLYFCESFVILLCARFTAGLGVGCVYGTLPMYIAEIAPIHLRGSLGSLLQLFDCFAYLIEYIVGSYVSYEHLILVSAALPLICFLTFIWIPESPYHLHNKGKKTEAFKALRYFRDQADLSTLKRDIEDIEASAKIMEDNKGSSCLLLFETKENIKCLYYAAALIIFQQGSGINVITFYSQTIFEESGSSLSANVSSIVVAAVMTVTSVITITGAKFFKLRQLLTVSAIGNTISMFALGTYFFFHKEFTAKHYLLELVPVTSLVLFIFAYTLGFGPLVWVITAAIFPSHLKALSCALTASLMWLLTFALTNSFNWMNQAAAFWLFGSISFVSLFFVLCQLPETQGKTFQEIQEMIQGKINVTEKSEKRTEFGGVP